MKSSYYIYDFCNRKSTIHCNLNLLCLGFYFLIYYSISIQYSHITRNFQKSQMSYMSILILLNAK